MKWLASDRLRRFLIGVVALLAVVVAPSVAQLPAEPGYSQDELDQLLAPIALYQDQLLTQILIAATYPLEVVRGRALRATESRSPGRRAGPGAAGQELGSERAIARSVSAGSGDDERQSRVDTAPGRRVSRRSGAGHGHCAVAAPEGASRRQSAVDTAAVGDDPGRRHRDRHAATRRRLRAGLQSRFIYGPWWAPAYPPWFWCPPAIYDYPFCPVYTVGIVFGAAWPIWYNHWGWAHPHWHGHHIGSMITTIASGTIRGIHALPPDRTWQHSPPHRGGVAYPDAPTRDRFMRIDPNAVRSRQDFRGYERIQPAPTPNVVTRQVPPAAGSPSTVVRPSPLPRPTAPRSTRRCRVSKRRSMRSEGRRAASRSRLLRHRFFAHQSVRHLSGEPRRRRRLRIRLRKGARRGAEPWHARPYA